MEVELEVFLKILAYQIFTEQLCVVLSKITTTIQLENKVIHSTFLKDSAVNTYMD